MRILHIFSITLLFLVAASCANDGPADLSGTLGDGGEETYGDGDGDGDGDDTGDGDGDGDDTGEDVKFDVLFIPDAPDAQDEDPELPQCIVVPKCSESLAAEADCPEGAHCVADPDPGHCEPDQDNATCTCGNVQCADGELCTWSDENAWYQCA